MLNSTRPYEADRIVLDITARNGDTYPISKRALVARSEWRARSAPPAAKGQPGKLNYSGEYGGSARRTSWAFGLEVVAQKMVSLYWKLRYLGASRVS